MNHIPENPNTNITPTDFEKLVHSYLSNLGEKLNSFESTHNLIIKKIDGNYQIDVYAEFIALGGHIKVLIECKKHKNQIKRETVQLLYDKLRATSTHKGMIFSTSGFQSGAIKFAKVHGIALVKVFEGKLNYSTKSKKSESVSIPDWIKLPKYQGEFSYGNSINYLQVGHLEAINNFIFGK